MAAIYKREKVISKSRAEALIQNELDQINRQEEEYYSSGGSSGKLNSHTIAQAAHDAELDDRRKNRRLERVSSVIERQKEIDRYRANPSPGATSGRNNKYTTAVSEQRKEITGLLDDIKSNYKAYKAYYGSSALSELESNLSSLLDGLDKKKNSAAGKEENQARGAFPQQFQLPSDLKAEIQKLQSQKSALGNTVAQTDAQKRLTSAGQLPETIGSGVSGLFPKIGKQSAPGAEFGSQIPASDVKALLRELEGDNSLESLVPEEHKKSTGLPTLADTRKAAKTKYGEVDEALTEKQGEYYSILPADPEFQRYADEGKALYNSEEELLQIGGTHKNKVEYAKDMLPLAQITSDSDVRGDSPYKWAYLTDYETSIYNYLLASQGETAADEFLSYMEETVNYRAGSEIAADAKDRGRLSQLGSSIPAGVDQWKQGTKQLFFDEALPASARQYASLKTREDLSNYGPSLSALGLGDVSLGQAAYDIGSTSANMAPSILLSAVTGGLGAPGAVASGVGTMALSASAAGNAYNEALKEGNTPDEAWNYAVLTGASEGALQYVLGGIGKLGGAATNHIVEASVKNIEAGLRRAALEIPIKMAGEGLEEGLQEVLEPVFRNLCYDENNEVRLVSEDVAYSAILGALSAMLFEAPGTISKNIKERRGNTALSQAGKVNQLQTGTSVPPVENTAFTNPGNGNMIETEGRTAPGPQERTVGDVTYRYTETAPEAYTPRSQEIKSGFDELGIESVVTDSAAESERNGRVVTQRGQASTLKDGSILVRNDADSTLSTGQIVGHEMYHVGKERHAAESQAFYDSIAESGNIDFQSEAFQDILNRIDEAYFNGKLDFATDYAKFYEEFAGYVSGNLKENGGSLDVGYSSMFYDTDMISTAWNTLYNVFLEDGKAGLQNGIQGQQTDFRGNAGENQAGNIRLLRSNGSETALGGEEAQESGSVGQIRSGAGAQAQSYGEIGNSSAAAGQTGGVSAQRGSNPYGTETGAEGRTGAFSGAIRATDPKSGRTVTVTGIADPDRATVQLSDGRTAAAGSIQYQDEASGALVKEAILMPSAASANVFLSGYHGGDVSLYAGEFKRYLSAGQAGNSFSYTSGRYGIGIIDSDVAKSAWYIGKNLAEAETRAQQKAANREKKTARTQEQTAYFTRDYDSALSREQEAQLSVLSSMAENRKQNIRVVDTIDGGKTNAYYNRTTGEIVVALDAKDGAYLYWAGHELTHKMRQWSPARYAELRDFVLSELEKTDSEFDLERRIREIQRMHKARGETLSRADAVEEIVANSVGTVFSDETAVRTFAQEHKTTMQKLAQWFDEFIQTLKEAVRRVSGRLPEATKIQKNLDLLEQIRDTAYRALEEMEGINTGGEPGGKRYSAMYRNRAKSFENFYDFVLANRNNPSETNKSFYIYTTPQGQDVEIFFDGLLHAVDHHSLSAKNFAKVLNSLDDIQDFSVSATEKKGRYNGTPIAIKTKTTDGYAGVLLEFSKNNRAILRTAFLDQENRIDSWIKRNGPSALANGNSSKAAVFAGNHFSIDSIQENLKTVNTSISKNAKNDTQNDTHEKKFSLNDTTDAKDAQRYDYSKSFAEQIDDYKNGKLPTYDTLVVGATPEVLQKIGMNALPMTYSTGHLRTILQGNKSDHDFGEAILKQLPEAMKSPVAVITSQTQGSTSIVAILEISYQGKQLVAPVVIDGYGRQNNLRIDSNAIASVHSRGNAITSLLNNAVKAEQAGKIGVYYIEKNKASALLQGAGLQLPSGLFQADGFIHSIRDKGSPVNNKLPNVTYSQQFKRWFGDWQNHPEKASKVVNADGTPKVMYHGTLANGLHEFRKDFIGSRFSFDEVGFFFVDHKGIANDYATPDFGESRKGEVIPVYLSIKKPLIFNKAYALKNGYGNVFRNNDVIDVWDAYQGAILDEAEEQKADGILLNDGTVQMAVAFEPNQIKSATDNIGTFDAKNPDIRYSLNDTTPENESEGYRETDLDASAFRPEVRREFRKITAMSDYKLLKNAIGTLTESSLESQAVSLYKEAAENVHALYEEIDALEEKRDAATSRADISRLTEYIHFREKRLSEWLPRLDKRSASPELQAVMRRAVSQEVDRLVEKYGRIRPGEKRVREVSVPKQTSDDKRVRQTVRTVLESGAITDGMVPEIQKDLLRERFSYTPVSNKESMEWAKRYLDVNGYEGGMNEWAAVVKGDRPAGKNQIALAEYLLQEAAQSGRVADALRLTAELAAEGTRAGQTVQALSMLKRLDKPEVKHLGELYYLQKVTENLNKDLLNRFAKKKGDVPQIQIDPALGEKLLKAPAEDYDRVVQEIMKSLAEQLPSTWVDKWNAWRYLAMLGNPKTHIRNLIGNAVFMPAVKMKNVIAAGMEKVFLRKNRTKAVYAKKEYRDFARADFQKVEDVLASGGKMNAYNEIIDQKRVFQTRWLEKARQFNSQMLEKEDVLFLRRYYISSLAQYLQANQLDTIQLREGSDALEKARLYAIREAQKATYRDFSAVAQWLSRSSKTKGFGWAIEAVLPFKKTPINILRRGIEYSPAGLLKTLSKGVYDLKTGKITANEFIDGIASGLTGTAIMAVGMALRSLGMIRGGFDDDDEEAFAKLQGEQVYSVKIGDTSYTVDWMAPLSMPLFIGVELMSALEKGMENLTFSDVSEALLNITEPMFNLSMLDGLNSMIDSVSYQDNKLTAIGVEAVSSYLQQAFPTLGGQIARTIDQNQRTTYTDKNNKWLLPEVQYFLQRVISKTPGLSFLNQPRLNVWGEEQEDPNVLLRAFENFLSPGYFDTLDSNAVETEIGDVYERTKEKSVLPKRAEKAFAVNGERKNLTAKEYTLYSKLRGQLSYEILDDMINLNGYTDLDDATKVYMVKNAYLYATALSKMEIAAEYVPDDKWILNAQEAETKYNIPVEMFILFRASIRNLESDQDSDGNTIPGSKKAKVLEVLDGLDLTKKQKDALYYYQNYGEKEIQDAPWN